MGGIFGNHCGDDAMEEQILPCKYISQKCPNYSPDSHTCNHGGGPYCGKFREFEKNNQ
jgi:hypothetical protein